MWNRIKDYLSKNREYSIILENFSSLSSLQIVNYVMPLITLPYLVRVLGAEKYGTIAFAFAFIQYFQIITDYGFNLSATKNVSINRENKDKVSEIFNSVIIIKIILMLISFALLMFCIFTFDKFYNEWEVYVITFGMVLGQILFPEWFFQGIERMKYIAILNIITKSIFTILVFTLIHNENDYLYVPLLNSLGYVISGIISMIIIYKYFPVKIYLPSFHILFKEFKYSTTFFLSRVSVSIYTSSNTFILGLFTNNTIVAFYVAAEKIYMAARGLYNPLLSVLYPYMASKKNKIFFKKIFYFSNVFNIIVAIIIFILSGLVINLLFGQDFIESTNVLKVFTLTLIVILPSMLLGYPFLAAFGYENIANYSIIGSSVFHLFGLIVISQLFINPFAIALLVLITESIIFITRFYYVQKYRLW